MPKWAHNSRFQGCLAVEAHYYYVINSYGSILTYGDRNLAAASETKVTD